MCLVFLPPPPARSSCISVTGKREQQSNPQNMVCKDLMRVHGVGAQTAKEWYNRGIRSVEQAQMDLLPKKEDEDEDGDDDGTT